jgi:hypothetical protein
MAGVSKEAGLSASAPVAFHDGQLDLVEVVLVLRLRHHRHGHVAEVARARGVVVADGLGAVDGGLDDCESVVDGVVVRGALLDAGGDVVRAGREHADHGALVGGLALAQLVEQLALLA